jgi:hypothetical protein
MKIARAIMEQRIMGYMNIPPFDMRSIILSSPLIYQHVDGNYITYC